MKFLKLIILSLFSLNLSQTFCSENRASAWGKKAVSGAKSVANGTWNLAKEYPKAAGSIAMVATLPFVIKKAANSCRFSNFLKANVPMVGCMACAGYDLTLGLLEDSSNLKSGLVDTVKLYFKIKSNKEEQEETANRISNIESLPYPTSVDRATKLSLQSRFGELKSQERDFEKRMKEAKEKANVYKVLYRVLRGSLAGAAGYQLFQNR